MMFRVYGIFALVLVAAVTIAVLLRDKPKDSPATASEGHGQLPSSPHESDQPSKENASQNVKDAITHLRKLVKDDPTNTDTMFELARLLQNSHNPTEALTYYKKGLRIKPDRVDARIDYSLCLFETGRGQDALEQNRIIIRHDPTNAKALYNIGAVHANTGLKDSAEFYWSRLISIHPDDDLAKQARANIGKLHEISSSR